MIRWLRERIEIGRLAQQRADRLVEENRLLRIRIDAEVAENKRLNGLIDRISEVVRGWASK
jgi:hypothetical protein